MIFTSVTAHRDVTRFQTWEQEQGVLPRNHGCNQLVDFEQFQIAGLRLSLGLDRTEQATRQQKGAQYGAHKRFKHRGL